MNQRIRSLTVRSSILLLFLSTWTGGSPVHAQEGLRELCTGDNCVPDTLEVEFLPGRESILEIADIDFSPGATVDIEVVTETRTAQIRGWSFAVRHDKGLLTILEESVTTDGTIADPSHPDTAAVAPNFDATQAVPGGISAAVILSFIASTELPVGERNSICRASYSLDVDPGEKGTKLEFVSGEIGVPDSPPTEIKLTVGSKSRVPQTVVDGIIRTRITPRECDRYALYFGPEAVVKSDKEDPVYDARGLESVPITLRVETEAHAFQMGILIEPQDGDYVLSFSRNLGPDEDRTTDIVITDGSFQSLGPRTPNTALVSEPPLGVVRGGAVREFEDSDFLFVNTSPAVGGEGLTVAYIVDEEARPDRFLAATPVDAPCPVHEILELRFEPVVVDTRFQRGNVDGVGELNVADAVFGLNYLFISGDQPPCRAALDTNADGGTNVTDMVHILNHLFLGGAPPAGDYPDCEVGDPVDCETGHDLCP